MSTDSIYKATVKSVTRHFSENGGCIRHLDIGSGSGELVRLLKERFDTQASCLDYTSELMTLPGQVVDVVDLNHAERLPYDDDSFDLITATEVIEHLEHFRKLFREAYRLLREGGLMVVSTPNVININSRFRNLCFGFPDLMGPLPVHQRRKESCAGHISPVSVFYIVHAVNELSFKNVEVNVDRYQRSGMVKMVFLWIPLKFGCMLITRREIRKYKTIDPSNRELVKGLNSLPLLLGRTVIVSALK